MGAQITDMQPGIHPNGLFWTTEIPGRSFSTSHRGRRARLRLRGQPLCDSIAFGEPIGLASSADLDIRWEAIAEPVERGLGTSVPAEDPGAFIGKFADASCVANVSARRTGFSFTANGLDASGFFAEIGYESNGAFLA